MKHLMLVFWLLLVATPSWGTITTAYTPLSYDGNDVATSFAVSWPFVDDADLYVTLEDSNGDITVLVYGTDYTVTGGEGSTGTVAYPVTGDPLATGEELHIERAVAMTQPTAFTAGGRFSVSALEDALDRMELQIQQLEEKVDRSAKYDSPFNGAADPVLPDPSNGQALGWAAGNLTNLSLASGTSWDGLTDLAETDGDELIGSEYTATGSQDSTVANRLDAFGPSVLDFIPVAEHAAIIAGTSTTDLATYLDAAATWSCTNHKYVYWPAGHYESSATVTFDSRDGTNGCWNGGFVGAGKYETELEITSDNVPGILITTYSGDFSHSMRFENFMVTYTNAQTGSLAIALSWDRPDATESDNSPSTFYQSVIRNLHLKNAYRGIAPYWDADYTNLIIFQIEISNIQGTSLYDAGILLGADQSDGGVFGGSNAIRVTNVIFEGTRTASGKCMRFGNIPDLFLSGWECNNYTTTANPILRFDQTDGYVSGKIEDSSVSPTSGAVGAILNVQSNINLDYMKFIESSITAAGGATASFIRANTTTNNERMTIGTLKIQSDCTAGGGGGTEAIIQLDASGQVDYLTIDDQAGLTLASGTTANLHQIWKGGDTITGPKTREDVQAQTAGALTAAQVSDTVVTNLSQAAADINRTLPTAAEGYHFLAVIATAQGGNYWRLQADTSDKIYLDGVAGSDNGWISNAAPAVGEAVECSTFQTGASAWDWLCINLGTGDFAAAGP